MLPDKKNNLSDLLRRAENYCAYQERSLKEVHLFSKKQLATPEQIEGIVQHLQQQNFLKAERFTEMFVQGKFRIKNWGKLKIKQALREKGVSDADIGKALQTLNKNDYQQTIKTLAAKKLATIKEENPFKRRQKLVAYLLQKGYEMEDILTHIPTNDEIFE